MRALYVKVLQSLPCGCALLDKVFDLFKKHSPRALYHLHPARLRVLRGYLKRRVAVRASNVVALYASRQVPFARLRYLHVGFVQANFCARIFFRID